MYAVESGSTKPQYNLAVEEYLCLRAMRDGSQFFMLWQNEPSIIIGRFQNTLSEICVAFVEERGIHVVRRNSGGGAVYHDLGNINYSFVMPDSTGDFDFALFTGPIIKALEALGVQAEQSGRNDLTIEGKKISGGAQFRRGGVILHHGTLLFDTDLGVLSRALNVSEDKFHSKAVKSVRSRVSNIRPFLSTPLSVDTFQEELKRRIENLTPLELSPMELEEVERLRREKYAAWEWNYGESPDFTEKKKMRFPWGGVEAWLVIAEGRIKDCAFRGDYFGSGEYRPLLQLIVGRPYTKESLTEALSGFEPHTLFAGASSDDLIALLSPES